MPYLTLDEIPEGRLCRPLFIPDDTLWLALFSGALTELEQAYNYEQFGTLTPQQMADACAAIIAEWYSEPCDACELPDGAKILTVLADGRVQELSGGEWQDPTGDYAIPPVPAREESTAAERRCLAATNIASVLEQVYEDMTDNYNLDVDPAIAFTSFVGQWSTVVLVAIGFLSFGLGTILFGVWTLGYQALEFLTEDVWNDEFTNKLICVLLSLSTDNAGVVTFDWKALQDRLAYNIDLGDPSVGELRLYAQILFMLQFVGVDGLNHAGATTGVTEGDCEQCEPHWCYEWKDELLAAWDNSIYTTYDDGFLLPVYGFGFQLNRPSLTFSPGVLIDAVEVEWYSETYPNGGLRTWSVNGGAAAEFFGGSSGIGYNITRINLDTPMTITSMAFEFDTLDASNVGIVCWISRIRFEGEGTENPLGEDNCVAGESSYPFPPD